MPQRESQTEDIDWDEIPPIGGLFAILLVGGMIAVMESIDIEMRVGVGFIAVLGAGYFAVRFNHIYGEQGLQKAIDWALTAPVDRKENQFASPSLKSVVPENKPTQTEGGMSLDYLRSMDEYEFEKLVAKVWQGMGYETRVTQASNDRGIDVIAEKEAPYHQKKIIQAKRYSKGTKVGSEEVQRYDSLRRQEDNVDEVVIVTTSSFTRPAQRTAKDLNVKPVNGHQFLNLYQKHIEDNEVEVA